jgi:DNA end-binding protein Ku
MRAIWTGNVTFGLVHIPVKLYAATEDRDVSFHQVHVADGGRIKYLRQCQSCHQTVTFSEIGKGYEDDTGRRVIISDEDLESLQVPHGRDVEIVQFAPAEQIDPLHFERAYYLEPASGATKPYVLLRQALQRTERVAVVTMSLRKRSRLALLRVRDDVLVLQTLLWPDEVRAPDFAGLSDEDVPVRAQELAMAGSLVESLSSDFDPGSFRDEYRDAVLELVARRLEGEDVIQPEATAAEASGTVVDLMAALQESVRRTQAARTASEESDSAEPEAEGADSDQSDSERSEGIEPGPASGSEPAAAPKKRRTQRPRRTKATG